MRVTGGNSLGWLQRVREGLFIQRRQGWGPLREGEPQESAAWESVSVPEGTGRGRTRSWRRLCGKQSPQQGWQPPPARSEKEALGKPAPTFPHPLPLPSNLLLDPPTG